MACYFAQQSEGIVADACHGICGSEIDMNDYSERRIAMVDCQVRPSDVTKFPIIQAMLEIPREKFVPDPRRDLAYIGTHIEIGHRRVILDPRILAKMLDALDIRPNELVLDIGSGLGYSTAVIARMAEAVVALEEDESMSSDAENSFADQSVDNAIAVSGNLSEGAARLGPFDVICIQGGIEVVPESIVDQLKQGGRIGCIFASGPAGECRIGVKHKDKMVWRMAFNAHAPILPGFEQKKFFKL